VLSRDKVIDANTMKSFLPEHNYSRLPVLASGPGAVSQSEFANEREILYKLFFDMKKDVNELKKMFFDLLQNPNIAQFAESRGHAPVYNDQSFAELNNNNTGMSSSKPVFLPHNNNNGEMIAGHEELEESLSIVDKEKELIIKALKKHKGKRKDASLDLGISERTLYRKLKEYDIEE
jgi:DNA-binding NtrC family response regulator